MESCKGLLTVIFEKAPEFMLSFAPLCIWNRTRNENVRSLDVIFHVDRFSKGEEKVLKETQSQANRAYLLLGMSS